MEQRKDSKETVNDTVENKDTDNNKVNEKKPSGKELKAQAKAKKAAEKEARRKAKEAKAREKRKYRQEHPTAMMRFGRAVERAAAAPINLHDRVQAACDRFFGNCAKSIAQEYHNAVVTYRGTGRKMVRGFFTLVIVTCVLFLVFEHFTVYQYAYNGRVLGYVKSQDTVVNLLNIAGKQLSGTNDANIKFVADENVTFKKVSAASKDVDDADAVINKLTYMTDIEVTGTGIYQNGKLLTVVEDGSTAKSVMDEVKNSYSDTEKGMEIKKIGFSQNVTTRQVELKLDSVQSSRQAVDQLENGGEFKIEHIIKEGETINEIASTYDVTKANMSSDDGRPLSSLEAGDIVVIQKTVDPLEVKTVESGSMSEVVKYKTIKKKSNKIYKGEKQVKQKGHNGRQIVTGTITKVNGRETKRDISKTEVVKKPVNKIVLIGTRKKPKTASTGNFEQPIRADYTINSNGHFGYRWGRMHEGLDYSCAMGTPIYASDGGTVEMAKYNGGYGLCVMIKHDNGMETLYGHCSKLLVSKGDKVYQGQKIALVGSTGHSTGAHLHFEIHVDGEAVDPSDYL
jgi:murein DD-endopeptidase MepM/ murein hydrolase activator NlpD